MISQESSVGRSEHSPSCSSTDWRPLAAGALLAFVALSKRSTLLATGVALGGGWLWYRLSSQGAVPSPQDLVQRVGSQIEAASGSLSARANDGVDEASMESFPASDAPARY